jgi:hypothetical protein
MMAVLDAIKKRGHFKDYKKAQKAYVEHKGAVKSAKAGLVLLDKTSKGLGKSRRALRKPRMPRQSPGKPKERPRCLMTP